jgi:uncharacterized membrane protein YbhN (UPF0104 family)
MAAERSPGSAGWIKRHWPLIRKLLMTVFVLLIVVSLVLLARDVKWHEVLHALRALRSRSLWIAGGLVVVSYGIYATFDVIGRAYVKHDTPVRLVMLVGFISYAFNVSLGSYVGGIGFRYRLYSRLGLELGTVTRILGLSLVTNWVGYFWLAGATFSSGLVQLPSGWLVGNSALRLIGVGLLILAAAYVIACGTLHQKKLTIRGVEIEFPSLPIAIVQSVVASLDWAVMGAIIWVLFDGRVGYVAVLGVLLLSSIAGAIAHIPGGVGVIEAVFVAMLAGKLPHGEILAVLVAYRALYYLAPLAVAAVAYILFEASQKKSDARNDRKAEAENDEKAEARPERLAQK